MAQATGPPRAVQEKGAGWSIWRGVSQTGRQSNCARSAKFLSKGLSYRQISQSQIDLALIRMRVG